MGNIDENRASRVDEARAKRLISGAIAEAAHRPEFRERVPGKLWVMLIQPSDAGTFRTLLNREPFEVVAELSGGRVTREQWDSWEQSPGIWVLSVVIDGEAAYSEVTEVKIERRPRDDWARKCSAVLTDASPCPLMADFVCMDRDGLQHFACGAHGDVHDFVRMPLGDFQAAAASGLPLAGRWQAGPGSTEDARFFAAKPADTPA